MAVYHYRAKTSTGEARTGTVQAGSRREAIRLLYGQGLTPETVTAEAPPAAPCHTPDAARHPTSDTIRSQAGGLDPAPAPELTAPSGDAAPGRDEPDTLGGSGPAARALHPPQPAASSSPASQRPGEGTGPRPPGRAGSGDGPGRIGSGAGRRPSARTRAAFWRQAAQAQGAGLSLHRTLLLLADARLGALSRFAERAGRDDGQPLSESMKRAPNLFGPVEVGLLRAAEASGHLDQAMGRLAALAEREMALRMTILPRLAYLLLVAATAVAAGFVITVVAPALMQGQPITLGFILARLAPPVGLVAVVTGLGWALWNQLPGLRHRAGEALLGLPVIGPLLRKLAIARFAAVLSELARAGVPVGEALELASGALGYPALIRRMAAAPAGVRAGRPLSELLAASGLFPEQVVQMVATGEEAGQTPELLSKVAEYYEGEAKAATITLVAIGTVLLLVLVTLGVGSVVIRGALSYAGALEGLMGP